MRKVYGCIAILIILLSAVGARAAEPGREPDGPDGNVWRKWDDAQKLNFINGFIAGNFYVVRDSVLQVPDYNDEMVSGITAKMGQDGAGPVFTNFELGYWAEANKARFMNERNRVLLRHVFHGLTGEQIKAGLDAFYKDNEKAGITVSDAIYLIKKEKEGAPKEEIRKILAYLSGGKKNKKELMVSDENGLVRYIEFP